MKKHINKYIKKYIHKHRPFVMAVLIAALGLPLGAQAHEGHDDAPAPASGNGPQRRSNASVFLPKPAQRSLQVRTLAVEAAQHARSWELPGRVIMDPNAGGKVQPTQAGRIVSGPQGLPSVGQAVRRGQVLAVIEPANGALERADKQAQIAELRAAQSLAAKRLARLQSLSDTVPRKDIEAAQSEVESLTGRIAALGAGLAGRETLTAPVSGVIAASNAVAGQVVDARELLFEIVDPQRLRIEALAYDPAQAQGLAAASLVVGDQRVPLEIVGSAHSLREQALPLQLRAQGAALSRLALGQQVRVFVQSAQSQSGFALPLSAVQKSPANQNIVWVKRAPEEFEPRSVVLEPLDGARVLVTDGLHAGERVVTQGAGLINQVR